MQNLLKIQLLRKEITVFTTAFKKLSAEYPPKAMGSAAECSAYAEYAKSMSDTRYSGSKMYLNIFVIHYARALSWSFDLQETSLSFSLFQR